VPTIVDELAGAATVSDLLAGVVKQIGGQFHRVALFRLNGNRLEGEHQIGFETGTDVTKLVLPLNVDSLLTRAVASAAGESLTGPELSDSSRAPFGGTPVAAMALPLRFENDTFAVVYADDSDQAAADRDAAAYTWRALFARLLVRQAGALLGRLRQELKTQTELRDYAAMLLQEAQRMHAADLEAKKPQDQVCHRLADTIQCARELFAHRAVLEGAADTQLLDERIAAAIEAEAGTPFARDLATVTGAAETAKPRTSRRPAEAS
jgi:hypothetical protein